MLGGEVAEKPAGKSLIRKANSKPYDDGKIATPVPREGCATFSGVPILGEHSKNGDKCEKRGHLKGHHRSLNLVGEHSE